MPDHQVTPFGEWLSPVTAESLVSGAVGINEVCVDAADVWWAESRPDEGGRTAVMRWRDGGIAEVTPPDAYVRTLVHEYGGGAWWVDRGVLFYVDLGDQRLRRLEPGGEPVVLTPEPDRPGGLRYADGRVTLDGRWFVCVHEIHPAPGSGGEARNVLAAVATDGSQRVEILWSGADFVMAPRISPSGQLAWISWNHPHMPWDVTTLHVHDLRMSGPADEPSISLGDEVVVVGNGSEALAEPGWDVAGSLFVCSDRDEWWNLYRVDLDTATLEVVVAGGFEIATPPWVFGTQRWTAAPVAPGPRSRMLAVAGLATGDELIVDGRTIALLDTSISSLTSSPNRIAYVGAGFGHESEVVCLAPTDDGLVRREVVRPARALPVSAEFLIEPEAITFPSGDGERAHALYYPPTNPGHVGPDGDRPPLMVLAHGGPTAAARRQLQLGIIYWTSRGIAVVDVDYRGSTGYGRTYRRALDDRWGIADVEDCVGAARYLAERGDVDGNRLMIRGGSAGGFTVLSALAFHDVFAAGASRYGVADLQALAEDTHKFESRYLDSLVGPWPDARATYEARSPINHVDGFAAPMIVLQGDEDEIVPPNQSEMIVEALVAKGIPVSYLLFEGEQHGFRKAENVVRALEAELVFFGEILGFRPAGALPPVDIVRP
jgi:dipeptidyl aminopeptidase/acylaminoacyl peptidase